VCGRGGAERERAQTIPEQIHADSLSANWRVGSFLFLVAGEHIKEIDNSNNFFEALSLH
jgi:hypothetical protein